MKTKMLRDLECGSLFSYGGIEWALLDYPEFESWDEEDVDTALCISAGVVEKRAFDDGGLNDFTNSGLRAWLNGKFIDHLVDHGADMSKFDDLVLDLTSDDGLRDYDLDQVKIGLITCKNYRAYRRNIPPVKEGWWTCTPWSTKSGADDDGNYVRGVFYSGALGVFNAFYGNIGVRPICSLQYDTLVSVEDGEDKSGGQDSEGKEITS
ncbi:MAG: hypothetical protein RSG50_04985 [Clostridia bacterium]